MTESLRLKLLNYRLKLIEINSEKPFITYCISKIGSVKTIERVLNVIQNMGLTLWICVLEEHISPADCYFVPSYDINPATSVQWKFDSVIVFLIKKI